MRYSNHVRPTPPACHNPDRKRAMFLHSMRWKTCLYAMTQSRSIYTLFVEYTSNLFHHR